MHRWVGDDALFPNLGPTGLELGLDQCHHVGAGAQQRWHPVDDQCDRDKGDVDRDDIELTTVGWQHVGVQDASVEAFERNHTGVLPELPGELIVSDVKGHHPLGTSLEQDVGEAPGRGSDVEGEPVARVDAKDLERMRELDPTPTDIRMVW